MEREFDDQKEREAAFVQRCKDLPDGGTFTLSWAQFTKSAPLPNLTGCSAIYVGPDEVQIFKPRH